MTQQKMPRRNVDEYSLDNRLAEASCSYQKQTRLFSVFQAQTDTTDQPIPLQSRPESLIQAGYGTQLSSLILAQIDTQAQPILIKIWPDILTKQATRPGPSRHQSPIYSFQKPARLRNPTVKSNSGPRSPTLKSPGTGPTIMPPSAPSTTLHPHSFASFWTEPNYFASF